MSSSSYFFFAARKWNDRQTVDESNSMKFRTTFVGEKRTYLTLNEWVNTYVVILPNEKWNKFTARFIAVVVISKFFANYFHHHKFRRPSNYRWENSAKCRANLQAELLMHWTPISNVSMPSLWVRPRLQIPLPTGLSRWAQWRQTLTVLPLPPIFSGICQKKNLADTWPSAKREDPGNEVTSESGSCNVSAFHGWRTCLADVIPFFSVFIIPFESNASIKPKETIFYPQQREQYPWNCPCINVSTAFDE